MVPVPESSYFPPLDKCLNGEQLLISWKTALSALLDSIDVAETSDHSAIQQFLSDPEVLDLLANPFTAFPDPSPQSKSAFETKTSAINVTPSSSGRYDIKQVKEDALWLSYEAKIDEVSALRVVVAECQSRTSTQLLGRYSDEELASILQAAGNSKFSSSLPVSMLSQGLDPESIQAEFDTQQSRKLRILRTYLSERQHLLKCAQTLLHEVIYRYPKSSETRKSKGKEDVSQWFGHTRNILGEKLRNPADFLQQCFQGIESNVKKIESGSGWSLEDGGREEIEIKWVSTQITEATYTMEMIFQTLDSSPLITSSVLVLSWFRLFQGCGFFGNFEMEEPSVQALFLRMSYIAAVISLSILSVGSCLEYLNDSEADVVVFSGDPNGTPYILNTRTITEIHTIMMEAAARASQTGGPAVLAWVSILQVFRSRISDNETTRQRLMDGFDDGYNRFDRRSSSDTELTLAPDVYQVVIDDIMDSTEEDPIEYLGLSAVNQCHVFETLSSITLRLGDTSSAFFSNVVGARIRIIILDLLRSSTAIGYIPEIVEAVISTLAGGQNYWDLVDAQHLSKEDDPLATFLEDEELVNAFLQASRLRYPYESLPFLNIVRAVAACSTCFGDDGHKTAIRFLETMPTFTYQLPDGFASYETTQEEDNNNNIRLTVPVQLFERRSKRLGLQDRSLAVARQDTDFCIPAGTNGRIINESGPKVVFWFHEYSGMRYLGKLLETFLTAGDEVDSTTGEIADRDSVAEIIEIFATVLLSISNSPEITADEKEHIGQVLEVASSGLSRNRDIITVIFDIFEEELQRQSASLGPEVPLEVLINCVHFIHALILVFPGRVWPLLGRSGLLGVVGGGGRLPSIVESVELVSGRYDLLLSCSRLFASLVDDFVANAITRRCGKKSSARFDDGEERSTGIPDQALSKVVLSFTRYLIDVLESSCSWKFAEQDDRRRLGKTITQSFDKILHYAYGIEASSEDTSKLISPLLPAASHIIDSFLSTSSGTLRFQPLLRAFYEGVETPELTTFLNELKLWTTHVRAVLSFSQTVLRVGILLEKPFSQLENQLFKASPLITRLYAVNDFYRIKVVGLFEALIVSAANNASEPPSLLGYLGPLSTKNFIQMLSDLDNPLSRDQNIISIWHFMSMVVSNRQQWFTNYLLTGKTPKDALKKISGKELGALEKPLLNAALDALSNITEIPKKRALAMLEFVALAQNFWPWTVYESEKHSDFIKAVSEYVGTLRPIQPSTRLDDAIEACYQTRIAAHVAEILAMHLFHSRQTGNSSALKALIPNLSYYARFAVAVPQYNTSLHEYLRRNFEVRYPGCSPRDLKRTILEHRQYGRDYFYDISIADKMLSRDQAWTGRKDDGLKTEFATANVNLSLVDAQIALFHNWKYLAIELSNNASLEPGLHQMLAKVATDCLVSNTRNQLSEEIFKNLTQSRADFSLVLAQRLIEANSKVPEMRNLLATTWDTIRTLRGSFERALEALDMPYYRSLLKILFVALRTYTDSKIQAANSNDATNGSLASPNLPIVLDILKYVVANGIREVAATIHEQPAESSPEDIALITGILQATLRIPGIELCHSQIVSMMVAADAARVATTLFSWSDSLALSGDPIYGELSILFLLELSSMPLMAEQLAIDGVLGHIAAANITSYLRRGNVGPFAEGAGLQRCYNIWVLGILPLLLNLLDAVQASIAAEVAIFLNQFPSLLQQSIQFIEAPDASRGVSKIQTKFITLSICSELNSLSLLVFILNGFRDNLAGTTEVPDVKWDAASVLESVEFWLGSRAVLRERILPMGTRDVEMARKKVEHANGGPFKAVTRLEEKVVGELAGIRDVLNGDA